MEKREDKTTNFLNIVCQSKYHILSLIKENYSWMTANIRKGVEMRTLNLVIWGKNRKWEKDYIQTYIQA